MSSLNTAFHEDTVCVEAVSVWIRKIPCDRHSVWAVQRRVRDSRAGYIQSMEVLRAAKACGVYTKSSIMLGLGEMDDEIIDTMLDLKVGRAIHPLLALTCVSIKCARLR